MRWRGIKKYLRMKKEICERLECQRIDPYGNSGLIQTKMSTVGKDSNLLSPTLYIGMLFSSSQFIKNRCILRKGIRVPYEYTCRKKSFEIG